VIWKKARGFATRHTIEVAEFKGYRLSITNRVRINGRWITCEQWLAYLDKDYLGCAATREGAKLIAVLYVTSDDLYSA